MSRSPANVAESPARAFERRYRAQQGDLFANYDAKGLSLTLVGPGRRPEEGVKREPPLSWGLRFIVRGHLVLDDGSVVELDDLSREHGLEPLPYLEELPDELELELELE